MKSAPPVQISHECPGRTLALKALSPVCHNHRQRTLESEISQKTTSDSQFLTYLPAWRFPAVNTIPTRLAHSLGQRQGTHPARKLSTDTSTFVTPRWRYPSSDKQAPQVENPTVPRSRAHRAPPSSTKRIVITRCHEVHGLQPVAPATLCLQVRVLAVLAVTG